METRRTIPLLPSVIILCVTLLVLAVVFALMNRWQLSGNGLFRMDRWTGTTYRYRGEYWEKINAP